MTYILTTTISREKLRLNVYEPDSVIVKDPESTNPICEREFYSAAVKLLALIWSVQAS